MTSELKFEIPTWDEIYGLLLNLADRIKETGFEPDIIVGVSRGGWPPARVMSDLLENPKLANITAEFYLGVAETKGEPVITQPVSAPVKGKNVLVVDDVADTGRSLRLVQSHLKENGAAEVKIATIYYKPWSVLVPDYYRRETSSWIIFPWERKETVRKVVERYRQQGRSADEAKEKLIGSGLDRTLVERFIRQMFRENPSSGHAKTVEELDEYIVMAGFRNVKIDSIDDFLQRVRRKVKSGHVQFFNSRLLAGKDHLRFAALNALKAFGSKLNRTKSLAVEVLLYASAQRQIVKAIDMIGITPDSTEVAVLIVAETSEQADAALSAVSGLMPGQRDDAVLELTDGKIVGIKKLFGISDLELESKLVMTGFQKKALVDLVIEHVALLATEH